MRRDPPAAEATAPAGKPAATGGSQPGSEWNLAADAQRRLILDRLGEIKREVGEDFGELVRLLDEPDRTLESQRDALATRLMELFRVHRSRAAFGLLFELARDALYQQVASRLRRYGSKADPNDVLQEVFVNVYRYPHRFNCEREDAFRLWSATIVRNTVLKHLRSLSRGGRAEVAFDDLPEQPEPSTRGPLRGVINEESQRECTRVFLIYLHLYLRFYTMLSEREQEAIRLVEVESCSYREAAKRLEIKLENLKMVIFRARRKIHRSMKRVFEGLPPDVRPARDPRSKTKGREPAAARVPASSSEAAKEGPR